MRERKHTSRPIGVLALQGDFAAHGRALEKVSQTWTEIRYPEQLRDISGLVIPGGESTTVTKFLSQDSFADAIVAAARGGMPVYGSCAGAILLSRDVVGNDSAALGLIDIAIERNAYGRQIDSFIAHAPCAALGPPDLEMVFIRAPKVRRLGPGVEALASWKDDPVFLRQGAVLVTTFHPELSDDPRVHGLFAAIVRESDRAAVR